ncbi:MAG: hypothetical protein JJE51_04020 [Thermoanaerobaculia bacterium]|nr:hypothetical protein [Thermoanaerobaculia bacterium]
MFASLLFEAFTGLGVVLACGALVAAFMCPPENSVEPRHEWTLRQRSRKG